MLKPPHRTLCFLLRAFSLLAALGGLFMVFAERPMVVRTLLRPPEGQVSTLLLSLLKEMGGLALMLAVLLWLAARDPVRNVAIVDGLIAGLCILAMTPVVSLWMTDIRNLYPAYLIWGRSVVRLAIAALLSGCDPARVGGNPLGISNGNIAWAGQDVAGLTPLRFGRPKTEETVKTLGAVLTLPQANSIVGKAV